jgi:hypothetical protein
VVAGRSIESDSVREMAIVSEAAAIGIELRIPPGRGGGSSASGVGGRGAGGRGVGALDFVPRAPTASLSGNVDSSSCSLSRSASFDRTVHNIAKQNVPVVQTPTTPSKIRADKGSIVWRILG